MTDEKTITVCDACLMACCWKGILLCWDAYTAGTTEKTIEELRALGREHECYWEEDDRYMIFNDGEGKK